MQLQTPRLCLDALRADDAQALYACRADPAVARFQGWCPADPAEAAGFIERQAAAPAGVPDSWFQRAIRRRETGELIGDIGIHLPADGRGSVEFGISIAPAWQGRGFAGEALRALFGWVFDQHRGHRIHASVDPRNEASVAMLRSLGMRQEAHHRESLWLAGEWVDDLIFAMLEHEWRAQQAAGRQRG